MKFKKKNAQSFLLEADNNYVENKKYNVYISNTNEENWYSKDALEVLKHIIHNNSMFITEVAGTGKVPL